MPCLTRTLASLAAVLLVALGGGCGSSAPNEDARAGLPTDYPTIVRRNAVVDPSESVYEEEWAGFYPEAARDKAGLWTFEGRLDFRGKFDTRSLGVRAEPIGVAAGHIAPSWVFVRPDADGSFRFRSLPPMRKLRLSLTGIPATLGGDYLDVEPSPGNRVELPVLPRSNLTLKLRRADQGPIGRWVVGLRRPGEGVYAMRGPNSHPNEGRGLHRLSRNLYEVVRFDGLHPGDYELMALVAGFGRLKTRVTIDPGSVLDLGELKVPRGHDLRVLVRGEGESPVPPGLRASAVLLETRARVTPNWPGRRFILEQEVEDQTVTATVDPDSGEAVLRGLFGGLYAVRVLPAATNAVQTPPLHVRVEGDTSATVELRSLAIIRGTALDEEGKPLEGAVVTSRLPLSPDYALQLSSSGPDGKFSFLVPEGLHEVTARWRGASFPRAELLLRAGPGEEYDLDMPFRPTAVFEGTIDLASHRRHEPLLSLHPRVGQWEKIGIPVDSDGSFRESVPLGSYDLFDGTDFLRRVDLLDSSVRSRFALDPTTAEVTVDVSDGRGRRIRHAWAALIPLEAALQAQLRVPPRFADRGPSGLLAFPSIPAGKYRLIVDAPGFDQHDRTLSVVTRGTLHESVNLSPAGGCVSLRVLRETDGDSVEEATVQQMTVDGRALLLGGRRTGRDGLLELRELPTGVVEFDVAPPTEVPPLVMARVRVENLGAAEFRDVDVHLAPGTLVRVVVYEGSLTPVKDASLEVECLRPDPAGEAFSAYIRHFGPVSGFDGSFPAFPMPRGRPIVLRVRRAGYPVLETVITPSGDDLMLVPMRYPQPAR